MKAVIFLSGISILIFFNALICTDGITTTHFAHFLRLLQTIHTLFVDLGFISQGGGLDRAGCYGGHALQHFYHSVAQSFAIALVVQAVVVGFNVAVSILVAGCAGEVDKAAVYLLFHVGAAGADEVRGEICAAAAAGRASAVRSFSAVNIR